MKAVLVSVITMIVVLGGTTYGIASLTGNFWAGFALGVAAGWIAYQTTLALNEISDYLKKE